MKRRGGMRKFLVVLDGDHLRISGGAAGVFVGFIPAASAARPTG